ncbi:hypothetical protein LNP26_28280 [Klebsiella variicola subsp. variicola]|nr:hypothetical protein [Klebsiella variicola subsp. variicola]
MLHCAGLLGDICPMDEQKPEVWQQVMRVNVNGTFMLTERFFAITPFGCGLAGLHLVQRWPSGPRQLGRLCGLKFATEGMMQVLADEYQSRHLAGELHQPPAAPAPGCAPAPSRRKIR